MHNSGTYIYNIVRIIHAKLKVLYLLYDIIMKLINNNNYSRRK